MIGLYFKEAKKTRPFCSKKMNAELLSVAMFQRLENQCVRCSNELYSCDSDGCYNYVKSDKDRSAYCYICMSVPSVQDSHIVGDYYTEDNTQDREDEYVKKYSVSRYFPCVLC